MYRAVLKKLSASYNCGWESMTAMVSSSSSSGFSTAGLQQPCNFSTFLKHVHQLGEVQLHGALKKLETVQFNKQPSGITSHHQATSTSAYFYPTRSPKPFRDSPRHNAFLSCCSSGKRGKSGSSALVQVAVEWSCTTSNGMRSIMSMHFCWWG